MIASIAVMSSLAILIVSRFKSIGNLVLVLVDQIGRFDQYNEARKQAGVWNLESGKETEAGNCLLRAKQQRAHNLLGELGNCCLLESVAVWEEEGRWVADCKQWARGTPRVPTSKDMTLN
jgi:hypothetical protein